MDGNPLVIELLEGEEVADKIFTILQPYDLTFRDRKSIMNLAKADVISYSREYAHVLSESVVINRKETKILDIYDSGAEPIDVIYEFVEKNDVVHLFQQLSDSIMPKVCELLECKRTLPIVHTHAIVKDDGTIIGKIDILKDEEPIDAIDHFAAINALDIPFRNTLAKSVCEKIKCNRLRPVVFRKAITDENSGQLIGSVKILEGEEVIDAAVAFLRKSSFPIDEITFKNYFLQHACSQRVKCTRNVAHVFDAPIYDENNIQMLGRLIVREDEEPSDKVYEFCETAGCADGYMEKIVEFVCDSELIVCKRKKPIIFSQPISDPDGNAIGNLGIELNEEPADSVYRFFATHRLFERNWALANVVSQICQLPRVLCNRQKSIKFQRNEFKMGNVELGPFVIWDDTEVIDFLYQKRLEFNLTLKDQMKAFSEICRAKDIYCARSQAIIYELDGITKKDFEKYGNETCSRKYNGWQFLTSTADSWIGSQLASLVAKDCVEVVRDGIKKIFSLPLHIFQTLFCPFQVISHSLLPLIVLTLMTSLVAILLHMRQTKYRTHVGHRVVFHIFAFLAASLSHAILIEPKNEIDKLMHIHEGKLPKLQILEGQEPVDAILMWGKIAAKDHHPIVREPIYWDLLEKTCAEIKGVKCKRRRSWEYIDMGEITVHGMKHKIDFFNPSVDPKARKLCQRTMGGGNRCVERSASSICQRIFPPLQNCVDDLTKHISDQLEEFEAKRLDKKDSYTKLGLEMDAPHKELFSVAAAMVRSRGMNISPFKRVDNGTRTHERWDIHTTEAHHVLDTHKKIEDLESREWNDKPCTPYFGGALCAKNDKDGNMIIEV